MEGFIIISGLLTLIIGFYLLTYLLNRNTPPPEGVGEIDKCNVCHAHSCSLRETPDRANCELNK